MRDYKHEYAEYQGRPEQIKLRAERNKARREEVKRLGHNPKGDLAHIRPLIRGGSNTRSNERIETVSHNRSWRKGQHGYYVPSDI
jgi:hypothetical protein